MPNKATGLCTDPENLDLVEVILISDEPDNAPGANDGDTTGDTDGEVGEDGFSAPVNVTEFFTFNSETGTFEGTAFSAGRARRGRNRTNLHV